MSGPESVSRKHGVLKLAVVLVIAFSWLPLHSQVAVGDDVSMNLTGDLGYGYSGAFGNDMKSSHANGMVGDANLTGYYYHPSFLSFQFRPYYNRSQSNSDSQFITRGTGFGSSVSLFSGSRTPGSISFGKDFSSNTQFQFAGLPSFSGDSSSQSLGITWSALFPKWPTLTASFTKGSTTSQVLGAGAAHSAGKNLTLTSGYHIAGFSLNANLSRYTSEYENPAVLTTESIKGKGTGTSYFVSAQHALPLRGVVNMTWTHNRFSPKGESEWRTTTYNIGNSFSLTPRWNIYQNVNYVRNLSAAYTLSALDGEIPEYIYGDKKSSGLFYTAGSSYYLGRGLRVNGYFNHRLQWLGERTYKDSQYGGSLTYNRTTRLFGIMYFGFGLIDTATKQGNTGLGFNANAGANKKIDGWDTSADFTYSQNVQTMVNYVTTSSYSYGFSGRRKLTESMRFMGAFRGSHSALVLNDGDGNSAESVSTGFSYGRYGFGASYSKSDGTVVLSSTGELTASPSGSVLPDGLMLFNGRSYAFSASTVFFRRFTVTGNYSNFTTNTHDVLGKGVNSDGDRYNVRTEYRLRKFSFISGYSRSVQDVSTIPGGPRDVNTFYFSLSRWFQVF